MRAASVRRGPHQSGEGRIVTGSNCRWRYRNPGDQRNKHYQYRYFRMQQVGGTSRRKDMPCRTHRLRDRNRRACPLSGLPGRASCAGEYASEPERDAALPDGRSSQAPQRRCGGEPDSEGRAACTRHQRHPQASGKSCMGMSADDAWGCAPNPPMCSSLDAWHVPVHQQHGTSIPFIVHQFPSLCMGFDLWRVSLLPTMVAVGRSWDLPWAGTWMMLPPLHCQTLGAPRMMWDEWTPTVSYPLITQR